MKINRVILAIFFLSITKPFLADSQVPISNIRVEFLNGTLEIPFNQNQFVDFTDKLSQNSIQSFYNQINTKSYRPLIQTLLAYKEKYSLDDWLYYQLIRRTAQQISPKAENYHRYTLYKWWLLTQSGYDATLTIAGDRILFYVQSDENIYNIPARIRDGKQYVCLNYHDYGSIDFSTASFKEIDIRFPTAKGFTYKITRLPEFKAADYQEKDLKFTYYSHDYQFKIKLNSQVKALFTNYPVVDYSSYFNIPLSQETYHSLIPVLKDNVKGMTIKKGVDYLMHFTRDAFAYLPDTETFGNEKRLSPEQTLLYDNSDCEDRAALFFCLVKEIYNLPMIVLAYPKHVTIAVKFDKPVGKPIIYNGSEYSVCEPTPQKQDLGLGQLLPHLKKARYEVAYAYHPPQ